MTIDELLLCRDKITKKYGYEFLPYDTFDHWCVDTINKAVDQEGLLQRLLEGHDLEDVECILREYQSRFKKLHPAPAEFSPIKEGLSVDDILDFLNERNREELKREKEIFDIENDGEFPCHDYITVIKNTKERVQIDYQEYYPASLGPNNEILHTPFWRIILISRSWEPDNVTLRVECERVRYFDSDSVTEEDRLIGPSTVIKKIRRVYKASSSVPYEGATTGTIEELMQETYKNLKIESEKVTFKSPK